jgi:hypothetical protein
MTRSALYPQTDHDIALGVTQNEIQVEPASIGGEAVTGLDIILLGYGCTQVGGGGGNDGILRWGESRVTRFSGYDMVSSKQGGSALCFGDSGGPAFTMVDGKRRLLGVNSKGNIKNTNYNARLDTKASKDFAARFSENNHVDICGVNTTCD